MPSWTHLIRFIAVEDHQSHIGQLIDTSRDVGLDSFENREIKAYIINGTIFDGEVTETVMTVKYVSYSRHTGGIQVNELIATITGRPRNMQLYPMSWAQLQ
jgi:hypothetical protein